MNVKQNCVSTTRLTTHSDVGIARHHVPNDGCSMRFGLHLVTVVVYCLQPAPGVPIHAGAGFAMRFGELMCIRFSV